MRKLFYISVFFLVTLGSARAQSQAFMNVAQSLVTNNEVIQLLQAPGVLSKLGELFDYFNSTGNFSGVANAIADEPEVSLLVANTAQIVFESLTKPAMNENGVSVPCQTDVTMFLEGLLTGKDWALNMIDAMGKPGSNIADRQTKFWGSFEECTSINAVAYTQDGQSEAGSFTGKYCSAVFPLPGIPGVLLTFGFGYLQLGVCVPNTCGNADVGKLISMAEKALLNGTVPYAPIMFCNEGQDDIGSDVIAAIVILGILGLFLVLGTIYDVITVQMKSEPRKKEDAYVKNDAVVLTHSVFKISDANGEKNGPPMNEPNINGNADGQHTVENGGNSYCGSKHLESTSPRPKNRSPLEKVLLAFSVYSNGVKILGTEQAGSLGAVNGIRFLSMAWVILGHTYFFALRYDANFLQHFHKKLSQWTFLGIIYADVSVDSFFTLSGLLVAYLSLSQLKKVGGPKNLNWFMYYFHRFWRLTPPYMLVMMVGTVILPYILDGPNWSHGDFPYMENCRDNWWVNLLYVNNYVRIEKQCMGWAWYLADDMQYYWISPLLLLPLFFHVGAGIVSCLAFLLATCISVGVITHDHRYPVQQYHFGLGEPPKDGDYSKNLYAPSYARMGPYIVGVFTGYLLYRWKCKCRIPKVLNLAGWFLSIALTSTIIYVRYTKEDENIFSRHEAEVFMALHRTAWGVALCWIIFSCATGHGGWINQILSWKPFIPLGRLSYCAYLIHPLVMLCFYSARAFPTYFTDYEVIYLFLAHLTLTYGLSFLVSLAFESPMMGLEKAIFNPGRK